MQSPEHNIWLSANAGDTHRWLTHGQCPNARSSWTLPTHFFPPALPIPGKPWLKTLWCARPPCFVCATRHAKQAPNSKYTHEKTSSGGSLLYKLGKSENT